MPQDKNRRGGRGPGGNRRGGRQAGRDGRGRQQDRDRRDGRDGRGRQQGRDGRDGRDGRGRKGGHDGRDGRDRREGGGNGSRPLRKPWSPDGEVPKWIADEVARVTPKQRVVPTLDLIKSAARAFAAGRYGKALAEAERAKELSPRDATVRELMGLSAYRMGRWDVALRELRTFRRFTGTTTHLPVEMDVLRAMERPKDVEAAWQTYRRLGGDRDTDREARVVYGSFLLDSGDARKAWRVTDPKKITSNPRESELRVWFVAARAAAHLGDRKTARRLYEAIQAADPAFPGLDELDKTTSAA